MFKRALFTAVFALAGLLAVRASILQAADSPLQGAWQIVDQSGRPGRTASALSCWTPSASFPRR